MHGLPFIEPLILSSLGQPRDLPSLTLLNAVGTPSANATVAVIRKDDIKNAKKAAKAAQKAAELNKMFGAGQSETTV